jgi:PAS domain S-box-containing protein
VQGDLAQLGRFMASSPDAMLAVGRGGNILQANPQAHELFGAEAGTLIGRSVDDLVPERLRGAHAAHRRDYGNAPTTRAMGRGAELQAARIDGTEFPTEISLSPMGGFEEPIVLAAIRDITDRKAAEWRERQAIEINDSIIQSLVVADYKLRDGQAGAAADAVRESIAAARHIVDELLGDPQPGDLRRAASAELGAG